MSDKLAIVKAWAARECGASLQLSKYDARAKVAYGWVTITRDDSGQPVVDTDEHLLPVEVLKRAVQDAFAEQPGGGKAGVNHEIEKRGSADVVETFVFTNELKEHVNAQSPDAPFFGPSKREGWMVGVRISDPELQKRLEDGELIEMSLRGVATDWDVV